MANKQLELMGRYMTEFGLTPASRARVTAQIEAATKPDRVSRVELVVVSRDADGNWIDRPLEDTSPGGQSETTPISAPTRIYLDDRL